jgi:hypothetical protein
VVPERSAALAAAARSETMQKAAAARPKILDILKVVPLFHGPSDGPSSSWFRKRDKEIPESVPDHTQILP